MEFVLFSFVYSRVAEAMLLPNLIYFGVGAISAVLAAKTLYQLRKTHPNLNGTSFFDNTQIFRGAFEKAPALPNKEEYSKKAKKAITN